MSIAYRKNTDKQYTQYTIRIENSILENIKTIAVKEDISINSCINQSLQFAIDEYNKTNSKK